jgi:hypothetical protein
MCSFIEHNGRLVCQSCGIVKPLLKTNTTSFDQANYVLRQPYNRLSRLRKLLRKHNCQGTEIIGGPLIKYLKGKCLRHPVQLARTLKRAPFKQRNYESMQKLWCLVKGLTPEQFTTYEMKFIEMQFGDIDRLHTILGFKKKIPYFHCLRKILEMPRVKKKLGEKAFRAKKFICVLKCHKRRKLYNMQLDLIKKAQKNYESIKCENFKSRLITIQSIELELLKKRHGMEPKTSLGLDRTRTSNLRSQEPMAKDHSKDAMYLLRERFWENRKRAMLSITSMETKLTTELAI